MPWRRITADMADSALSIRTITESDLPEFSRVVAWAFLDDPRGVDSKWLKVLEHDRTHVVLDGDEIVGTAGILSREITLPGDVLASVGAVTVVTVKPGHRRRGVASLLMKTQLDTMHESGEAIAILWASEGSIYRRFGYGELATSINRMTMPTRMAFHPGVSVSGARIRQVTREEALPFMREVHDRVRRTRVGWLSRADETWNVQLADREVDREGLTSYRYCVHPEGYVVFRVKGDRSPRGPQDEPRFPPKRIRGLFIRVVGRVVGTYELMRLEILRFLIGETVHPAELARACGGFPQPAVRKIAHEIHDDLSLRMVWLAYRIHREGS